MLTLPRSFAGASQSRAATHPAWHLAMRGERAAHRSGHLSLRQSRPAAQCDSCAACALGALGVRPVRVLLLLLARRHLCAVRLVTFAADALE